MEEQNKSNILAYRGYLKGHGGWVTSLVVGEGEFDGENKEYLMSASRDKTMIRWDLEAKKDTDEEKEWGKPRKMYTGHSHFIEEICLTGDSKFCFSASWDGTVRLWNVQTGKTFSKLIGHSRDVLSVAISPSNNMIMTGSRDSAIKIWNTRSECRYTVEDNAHTEPVSCVRFYHQTKPAICVSASWDRSIKVWDTLANMELIHTFTGHKSQITTLDMVIGDSFLASGSNDGHVMVWDMVRGRYLMQKDCESPVNCVLFSQKLFWLVIGTNEGIIILDLPAQKIVQKITAEPLSPNHLNKKNSIACLSLAWGKSGSGNILYSGWSDSFIRVYEIESKA
jgi:guanine nucleotide-binding protein subunit beta-2-like 1 protein